MPRLTRLIPVLFALLLASAAAAQADAPPVPGQMIQTSYTNNAGTRTYFVYEPTTGGAGKPLMVWLHGCGGPLTQQGGHALAAIAEQDGFTLAYPDQSWAANPADCWNWFVPADNQRGQGEASIIAGITTTVRNEVGGDPSRVYIGGYSAGGAMTTVMGAAYPDLYAAIAPSAGAPYNFDVSGQSAFAAMGPFARPIPAWLLQGIGDEISNYVIGRTNLLQWLNTDSLAGAGQVSDTPSSVDTPTWQTSFGPVPATVEHYVDNGCELAQFNSDPLEHLSNGYLISTDSGLSIEQAMMNFLLAHRLGATHQACG